MFFKKICQSLDVVLFQEQNDLQKANPNLPSRCPDCKAAAERVKSIASTRTEKNWLGQIKRDESGRPIKFHYDKDGRQVGQTKTETNWQVE
jgi:hypothetical protein